ncbi:uncharacterized protein LOC126608128 isoform X2 [Malus sylvestris]|uniref:uncharacterized protein LOC126608128 isoform X2 n=1 Tax=Malus sylvestris TaxID=3752 RepID=UPI0021ABA452|nr:uncharacterized protein LOC126608128 isoform X2 [Malus sylvestris]
MNASNILMKLKDRVVVCWFIALWEDPEGDRVLKQADVVAPAMAKKKLTHSSKKSKTDAQNTLSKQPHSDAETAGEATRPTKRVKKLAKNGAREIHVISSHTTGTITPNASPLVPVVQASAKKQPSSTNPATQAHPAPEVPEVAVEPVVIPLVETSAALRPTLAPILGEATPLIGKNLPKNLKQSAIILEEDDESDEILPVSCSQPTVTPSIDPPPVVEVTDQVDPLVADRGKRPIIEPEATSETPIHPQDQDLIIPSQEATSAFCDYYCCISDEKACYERISSS